MSRYLSYKLFCSNPSLVNLTFQGHMVIPCLGRNIRRPKSELYHHHHLPVTALHSRSIKNHHKCNNIYCQVHYKTEALNSNKKVSVKQQGQKISNKHVKFYRLQTPVHLKLVKLNVYMTQQPIILNRQSLKKSKTKKSVHNLEFALYANYVFYLYSLYTRLAAKLINSPNKASRTYSTTAV